MTSEATRDPAIPEAPASMTSTDRLVIYLLLATAFVVMLNETIVSVALPRMVEELEIEPATGQWLVTAFMLTMAVVIPITGFLMRRFSTRTLFLGAISVFIAGTVIASVAGLLDSGAPVFPFIVVARVVQAAGTGVMVPLLMTTIMTLVPPHERGKMMGNISIVMAAAPVIGPLIGGFIINVLPWHWVFVIVLPFAVATLVIGALRMRNVTTTERVGVDVLSIVLSAVAFGGLVYGLSEFGTEAQARLTPGALGAPIAPWIPLVVGAVALLGWVLRQLQLQRTDRALIDLRVFASAGFTRSIIVLTVSNLILFGTLVLLPFYIQNGLGMDPLQSALIVLPGGVLMGFAGPFVGAWYDRVGPKPLVIPGAIVTTVALGLMALLFTDSTPWWVVTLLYVVLSIGLALQFGPLFTASLGSVEPRFYSSGSATLSTLQQVAGAAGTSLFIVIFTLTAVNSLASLGAAPTPTDLSHAYVSGTVTAMIAGTAASLIPIVLAFFVRRPTSELAGTTAH